MKNFHFYQDRAILQVPALQLARVTLSPGHGRTRRWSRLAPVMLAVTLVLTIAGLSSAAAPTTASRVYGQLGDFTTGTVNNGGVSATSLRYPSAVVVDSAGGLYVADYDNNRVLHYPSGSTTADVVYGQGGSFTSTTVNNGGVSATSLYAPNGVAVDSTGGLYVADYGNNRVLHYPSGSTTADVVYGQGGSFTSTTVNNGGVSATSLRSPIGVAVDNAGGLYVADYDNNRVLHYPSGSTTADVVYGQGGSFTSTTVNNGGVSATSLYGSYGVAADSAGGLYVADFNNNRVLHYPSGSTTADVVYGQGGSFTSTTANNGGVSATSLNAPIRVVVDSAGGLYVADFYNNRVLHYPSGSTTADVVYGQGGSFTSTTANNGGVSATSLSVPFGVAVDSAGGLYVADYGNSRVLYYGPLTATTSLSSGPNPSSFGQSVTFTATVTPITATGTVSFQEGANTLGTGTVNANGVATFSTSSLVVGSHVISATYGGDNSYASSSSSNITQVVNQVSSTTSLSSGPNPSSFGQSVTFTATVSVGQPLAASGIVTFSEGVTTLGTGTLNAGGIATYTTSTLSVGNHVIVATYGGDNNYNGSSSSTITQVVNCPLLVTSGADDGSCGTLRYAINQANTGGGTPTITITLSVSSTISLTNGGITLNSGVKLITAAACGANGPAITVKGIGNSSGDGLTLKGNNTIYGIWIRGFSGRQLVALAPVGGKNTLQCVKASKS